MPSELREKLRSAIYSVDFGLAKWDGEKYMAMDREDVNRIIDRIMAVLATDESSPSKPVALLQNDPDALSLGEKIEMFKALNILNCADYQRGEEDSEVFQLLKGDLYERVRVAYSRDVADKEEEVTDDK